MAGAGARALVAGLGLVLLAATRASAAPAYVDPACSNADLPPALLGGAPSRSQTPLRVVTARAPKATLTLAVAANDPAREAGLMCVLRLDTAHGMLFVFSQDDPQGFWMKDTLVPLDMVWVRGDGTVDTVAPDVPASTRSTPDDRVARRGGTGRYVIELAAGGAARAGIVRGAKIAIPAQTPEPIAPVSPDRPTPM